MSSNQDNKTALELCVLDVLKTHVRYTPNGVAIEPLSTSEVTDLTRRSCVTNTCRGVSKIEVARVLSHYRRLGLVYTQTAESIAFGPAIWHPTRVLCDAAKGYVKPHLTSLTDLVGQHVRAHEAVSRGLPRSTYGVICAGKIQTATYAKHSGALAQAKKQAKAFPGVVWQVIELLERVTYVPPVPQEDTYTIE